MNDNGLVRHCVTFMSCFLLIGKQFLIHYTGTAPQRTRFYLLNSNDSDAVLVSIFYSRPNRLDMFYNGVYIMPTNGRLDPNDGSLLHLTPPLGNRSFYLPDLTRDSHGANYFDRKTGIFTFLLKGSGTYEIKTTNTLVVSHKFPPMHVDEFYRRNIVWNLALFLGIPSSRVKLVDVIPEDANFRRRRRRSTGSDNIVGAMIEINGEIISGIINQ